MELISEPAVVTAVADAGPRERLLTFFTRNQGGVRLYAKRLPRKAHATTFLEPLQGGELVFQRPHAGARGRLRSFVPQRVWPGIRSDLGRTVQAIAFFELLTICLAEGEPRPEVFTLLVEFLNALETERRPGLARILATLRLLEIEGFSPHLDSCVGCRGAVAPGTGILFSPDGGGVVCRACLAGRREQTIPVSPGAHALMLRALTLPGAQARRLRVPAAVEREAARVIDTFVEARTGVRPRSGASIERLGEAGR